MFMKKWSFWDWSLKFVLSHFIKKASQLKWKESENAMFTMILEQILTSI